MRPKSNIDFWAAKLDRNARRDIANLAELEALGWRSETVWECELADGLWLDRVLRFLGA